MANRQNLIPFNKMTVDRHRELSSKGGKASGAARRARKAQIEQHKIALAADNQLFRETVSILCECTKLLRHGQQKKQP